MAELNPHGDRDQVPNQQMRTEHHLSTSELNNLQEKTALTKIEAFQDLRFKYESLKTQINLLKLQIQTLKAVNQTNESKRTMVKIDHTITKIER